MTNLVDRLPLSLRACCAGLSVVSGPWSVAERAPSSQQLTTDHGPRTSRPTRGLTLIEMLVALAITLVMMAAVVNLFANMSESIRNRRAAIETGSQLRQVRNRLAMDLSGATCRGSTWQDPAENQGYIEIIEGQWTDKNPSEQILPTNVNTTNGIDTTTSLIPSSQAFDTDTGASAGGNIGAGAVTDGRALGDWDDILALTVRSESDPFVSRVSTGGPDQLIESPLAEVVWFATEQGPTPADPNNGMRRIYRRVLIIAPWLGTLGTDIDNPPNNVSVHWEQTGATIDVGRWVANTLGDLTKRENRIARNPRTGFPHPLVRTPATLLPGRTNTDALVLSNALAFDVRVFDPGAPVYENAGVVVEPSDYGWDAAYSTVVNEPSNNFFDDMIGQGAYVDMGYATMAGISTIPPNRPAPAPQPIRPVFAFQSTLNGHPTDSIYDTWSYHYENDGIDQDNNGIIDQGANGLDDDNANGVDDRGERETSPPYDVPLRGVKVILRVYEPDSRQIRESSVTHSFKQ